MSEPTKYFGSFSGRDSIAENFLREGWDTPLVIPDDFPSDDQILLASYGGAAYEGDAYVVYERDGKLYEVHGSHCSCYGLEGQWAPEETSWAALAMRKRPGSDDYRWHHMHDHDDDAQSAYWRLVDAHVTPAIAEGRDDA